jgi:hypothetical protein
MLLGNETKPGLPELNWLASTTVGALALAVIGPMAGIVASRRLTSLARCQASSRASKARTSACYFARLSPRTSSMSRASSGSRVSVSVRSWRSRSISRTPQLVTMPNQTQQSVPLIALIRLQRCGSEIARPVKQQNSLLLCALDRNKANGRPLDASQIASASAASLIRSLH